jgi:hypothetical protein
LLYPVLKKASSYSQKKDIAIVPLLVKLPNKEITTGYGVHWPEKAHDLSYYVQLAEKVGFKMVTRKEKDCEFKQQVQRYPCC